MLTYKSKDLSMYSMHELTQGQKILLGKLQAKIRRNCGEKLNLDQVLDFLNFSQESEYYGYEIKANRLLVKEFSWLDNEYHSVSIADFIETFCKYSPSWNNN